jgi:hypothetical protein
MRSDVAEQERLNDLLRELAAHDARAEPPARVERAVMKQRMERLVTGRSTATARPALPGHRRGWLPARVALGVAGVAAALLIAAWAATRPTDRTGPAEPRPEESSAVVQVESIPHLAPAEARPLPVNAEEQPSPAAPNRATPRRTGIQPVAGEAGPFVRLLPMMEQELGTIRLARVRLPDQAVRTLGLGARTPLSGIDGFVEADVLLGEDGVARAIRFVR